MSTKTRRRSYTVPCSSAFRDDVLAVAGRHGANVADLARSVVLMVPLEVIAAYPDPGDPPPGDRETVVLKTGVARGRPWRRKPRLQVRMAPGHDVSTIRRALAIALALDRGEAGARLERQGAVADADARSDDPDEMRQEDEVERLRAAVSALSFDPLPDGVRNRDDALHVLGLPPGRVPDRAALRARFRLLATIHHPDGPHGCHKRMSQLNAAMEVLRRSTP